MSDLHPAARALIDAAKESEASLPSVVRARVHRSVLRRAVALGVAVATTSTASTASKAAALVAALTGPLAVPSVIGAIAGVAFFVLRAASAPHESPRPGPSPAMHGIAQSVASPVAANEVTPAISSSMRSATSQEPAPAVPTASVSRTTAPSNPLTFEARLPPRVPAQSPVATPVVARPAVEPAVEAIEPPRAPADDDGARASAGPTTLASGVRTTTVAGDLAADLDLLRQVHTALREGRADVALSLLDRTGKGLDAGPLAEEAQVARISALCQLGRVADAVAATNRFLVAWPASPVSMRLRGGCAALGANSKGNAN